MARLLAESMTPLLGVFCCLKTKPPEERKWGQFGISQCLAGDGSALSTTPPMWFYRMKEEKVADEHHEIETKSGKSVYSCVATSFCRT